MKPIIKNLLLISIVTTNASAVERLVSTSFSKIFNMGEVVCLMTTEKALWKGQITKLAQEEIQVDVAPETPVGIIAVLPEALCQILQSKIPKNITISEVHLFGLETQILPTVKSALKTKVGTRLDLNNLYDDYHRLIVHLDLVSLGVEVGGNEANGITITFKGRQFSATPDIKEKVIELAQLPRVSLYPLMLNYKSNDPSLSFIDFGKIATLAVKSQKCRYELKITNVSCFGQSETVFLANLTESILSKLASEKKGYRRSKYFETLAALYYIQFDFANCYSFSREALKEFPRERVFFENIVVYYLEIEDVPQLMQFLKDRHAHFPQVRNLHLLASAATRDRDYLAAETYYKQAIALQRGDLNSIIGLLMLKLRRNERLSTLELLPLNYYSEEQAPLAQVVCKLLIGKFREAYLTAYSHEWKEKENIKIISKLKDIMK